MNVATGVEDRVSVAVETPQHAGLGAVLDYLVAPSAAAAAAPVAGTLVRVPLGRRTVPGIVWPTPPSVVVFAPGQLKPLAEVVAGLAPLPPPWIALVNFAAGYYQRGIGELALTVLPPELRKLTGTQIDKRVARLLKAPPAPPGGPDPVLPALTPEQAAVLAALADSLAQIAGASTSTSTTSGTTTGATTLAPKPTLLHGATGSGKTEVYLRAAQVALDAGRQVLVLVPEINLTPQLEARFAQRFPKALLVSLHSALTPAQRLKNWLLAHLGLADLVLGTRLAIFTPMPRLGLIVVDEEHDPSFKQQEGARYSARDLAVYRAHIEMLPVILGSATPALESWQRCIAGKWQKLVMPQRIGGGAMPRVRLLDMTRQPRLSGDNVPALAAPLLAAIEARIARGEQSLLLLNRRGYAPVLHCGACAWKSQCPHCSAWRVFHKFGRTLRCHHCGFAEAVPRACPDCGNLDIAPIGRGTEKLEEQLGALLPGARIARIDADTTRLKGTLDEQLAAVHAGDVDVLVGTQMVTKGHDFRRITLVAAVNPDGALFASDFRASERLFSLLLQAAGRAGRDAEVAGASEMWLQTWHPQHPVYAALRSYDFEAFAAQQLAERQQAGLPPFVHLALLRAEARSAADAAAFLRDAAALAAALTEELPQAASLMVYPPVPPVVARVADIERMQMLVESASRGALQRLLAAWLPQLHLLRSSHKGVIRWAVDVDPLAI